MKELHLVIPPTSGNMAGIERVTLHCALGLASHWPGVPVVVHMFGTYKVPAELSAVTIEQHPDCSTVFVGRILAKHLRKKNIQWVIAQPMTALSIALWNPSFAFTNRPLVIFHGALHIEMSSAIRKQLQYLTFGWIARRLRWKLAAVSRALSRKAEVSLGLPHASVRTLYNPSFISPPRPRDARPKGDNFKCLAIGRLHPQKGFDVLIPAFHASGVGEDARLLILGEGPQRAELEHLIENGPRASQIEMPGYSDNVLDALREADLFIMPSRYEGLAGTLVEALAVGTPVLAVDHPYGAREILAEGRFGRLLPPLELGALTQGISYEYQRWERGEPALLGPSPESKHIAQFRSDVAVLKYARLISRIAKNVGRPESSADA